MDGRLQPLDIILAHFKLFALRILQVLKLLFEGQVQIFLKSGYLFLHLKLLSQVPCFLHQRRKFFGVFIFSGEEIEILRGQRLLLRLRLGLGRHVPKRQLPSVLLLLRLQVRDFCP